jgi:SM-20-related protein
MPCSPVTARPPALSTESPDRMIRLNGAHDVECLGRRFATDRRLQIRNFLMEEDAERIHRMLAEQTPWWTAFNDGKRVAQVSPEIGARLTPEQIAEIKAGIQQRAQRQYQFLYDYYPLFAHYFLPEVSWMPLFEVFEFLNSAGMLDFFRLITGRRDIRWADGQATLYRAGNFLQLHTDEQKEEQRIAAYVLNLTRDWESDWGGYLQFFDGNYDVEHAYRPIFNALNIFLTPASHSVGMVSTYAPGCRYSITGWLRGDEPPGAFGRKRP